MNALPNIVINNKVSVLKKLLREKPLPVLSEPGLLFTAPNYSGVDVDILCKIIKAKEVTTLFCDSSGFGRPGERALTKEQAEAVVRNLIKEHGKYNLLACITSVGQFQVYVTILEAK